MSKNERLYIFNNAIYVLNDIQVEQIRASWGAWFSDLEQSGCGLERRSYSNFDKIVADDIKEVYNIKPREDIKK